MTDGKMSGQGDYFTELEGDCRKISSCLAAMDIQGDGGADVAVLSCLTGISYMGVLDACLFLEKLDLMTRTEPLRFKYVGGPL